MKTKVVVFHIAKFEDGKVVGWVDADLHVTEDATAERATFDREGLAEIVADVICRDKEGQFAVITAVEYR